MSKILLINPQLGDIDFKDIVAQNLFYNSPPLGLCYIAAVLEKNGFEISLIDAPVERLRIEDVLKRVIGARPDVIGLTSVTANFSETINLARSIKRWNLDIPIIIGGPHISVDPFEAMSCPNFDFAVVGEGEITTLELSRSLANNEPVETVKGLVFRKDGKLHFTGTRNYLENLDKLPFPARHLLKLQLYKPQPNDERALPKLSMIASRGCPYGCIFCDKSVFGRHYRSFSPKYIVSEMSHLVTVYGARDIAFLDSTFTASASRVEAIIEAIKKARLKVNWTCTVRADIVTKELLKKMKDAGCWRVRLGIESGSDEVLKFINKGLNKEQIRKVTRWADEIGLQPKGFFMIGHLTDTKKSIEETISFAKELPLKDITVQINTVLKNTQQEKLLDKFETRGIRNKLDFTFWRASFLPKGLNEESLLRYLNRFYRSFYLRPIIILRHLKAIRTWRDIERYLKNLSLATSLFFKRRKMTYSMS